MSNFICPVCEQNLELNSNIYRCKSGHCFDRARSGYVNLLQSQTARGKRHGDDKAMVLARHSFLEKGYYRPLLDALTDLALKYAKAGGLLLDAGCGEGFFTTNIHEALKSAGKGMSVLGVDISRDAVDFLARRNKELQLAVASVFHVPVGDYSCDIILSVFSPVSVEEIVRLLRPGAVFIRAYPLEKHLLALKRLVYDNAYENKATREEAEGLALIESHTIKEQINVESNEHIRSLFMMTPYYYKTGRDDQRKLEGIECLRTEIEFGIDVFRRM